MVGFFYLSHLFPENKPHNTLACLFGGNLYVILFLKRFCIVLIFSTLIFRNRIIVVDIACFVLEPHLYLFPHHGFCLCMCRFFPNLTHFVCIEFITENVAEYHFKCFLVTQTKRQPRLIIKLVNHTFIVIIFQ